MRCSERWEGRKENGSRKLTVSGKQKIEAVKGRLSIIGDEMVGTVN